MADQQHYGNYDIHFDQGRDEIDQDGTLIINKFNRDKAKFPDFLPTWNPSEKYPPLKFFKFEDKGALADKNFSNLFPAGGDHVIKKVTPKLGSVVSGVQLSSLSDAAKNDLALFVAERGVVIFRDQDFTHRSPKFCADYARYFGPLHIHPTSGAPKGVPELHITYRRADEKDERIFSNNTNSILWHSDCSFELQPPGLTFFSILEGPESGGDTLFADNVEAYKRLSPEFQKRLSGLHVLHTSEDQASNARGQGGVERRKPVSHIHPLIRTHPVTKEKYIYLNKPFSRQIIELKEEESSYLLNFLYNHLELSHDLQLRANWEPNTVVLWDNRTTTHTSCNDYSDDSSARHGMRISVQAERPVEHLHDLNKEEFTTGDVEEAFKKVTV